MVRLTPTLFTVLLLTVGTESSAESLLVIYDSGNTVPIDRYIKINGSNISRAEERSQANNAVAAVAYPVTTPSMTPGRVKSRALSIPHFQTPLFIVGNDSLSMQWLAERVEELKSLNAIGLLVEAASETDLVKTRRLANGLNIVAVSGEAIAEQLKLTHYPVLISKTGLEQ